MEEKSKIIESIDDIFSKEFFKGETYGKIYNKYKTIKELIIYFFLIFFFSLILKIFFILTNKSINIRISKNNTFINKFDNKDYKYINKNENKKIMFINNYLDNLNNTINNYIYNIINKNDFINNYNNLSNNSEIMSNDENKKSFIYTKKEVFNVNETLIFKNIQEEIKKYQNNEFNISFDKIEDFYERTNPKISIIITIYNQESFLNKIYACIQNQSLKDIEIIFVDDDSIDNSSIQINKLMKKDKRIKYIKNPVNKGQFYSRYRGIKTAKGEYILVIDPDDLLLNNILISFNQKN